MTDATSTARERAEVEATLGGTCANRPGSQSGDGPLTRARFAFADRAEALSDDVRNNWTSQLGKDRQTLALRIEALSQGEAPVAALAIGGSEAVLLQQLANASNLESDQRRKLFAHVFDDARAFTAKANGLRQRQAPAFAARLDQLAAEVGPDPQSPGRPNPARGDDPSYCWDTVLNEKLNASAALLRNLENMPAPEFEFTEGPKATRAAFFNLARVLTSPFTKHGGGPFGEKEFIALFASIAVDAGIFFLTFVRSAMERKAERKPRYPEPFDLNPLLKAYNKHLDPKYDPRKDKELQRLKDDEIPLEVKPDPPPKA